MLLAPIPVYLVWDRFEKDLDAGMVYEQLMDCQHELDARTHAMSFLRSCLLGRWRDNDAKPFLPAHKFFHMLALEARLWVGNQFAQLLPMAGHQAQRHQVHMEGAPPGTPTMQPPLNLTTPNGIIHLDAAMLWELLQTAPTAGAPAAVTPKKEDSQFKVLEGEKARMKNVCGLEETVGNECFPC